MPGETEMKKWTMEERGKRGRLVREKLTLNPRKSQLLHQRQHHRLHRPAFGGGCTQARHGVEDHFANAQLAFELVAGLIMMPGRYDQTHLHDGSSHLVGLHECFGHGSKHHQCPTYKLGMDC
jgi:hypothetical protein